MKVAIRYHAEYRYERAVGFSTHRVRLFPRSDHFVMPSRLQFSTNPGADIQYRRDLFDNHIAVCFYPDKADVLICNLSMDLELRERNAFHFLVAPEAAKLPFSYPARERVILAPYLEKHFGDVTLPFWKAPVTPRATVETLVELNQMIYEELTYERRDEGEARSPAETLERGSGACRDFTVLLAEVLRTMGLAARMASGYLCEFGEEEKTAEGALHAWVEVFLPGAGWIGLDPTNGIFCNHNHITAAVGLAPADVTPIDGNYYGKELVASEMTAKLELIECPE